MRALFCPIFMRSPPLACRKEPMRLYLAPHHDDILLALPSWLLSASDEPACIVVVFSTETDNMAQTCNKLHRELGIEVHELGFEEARRRGLSLRTCLRTCLRTARPADLIHRTFPAYFNEVFDRLKKTIARLRPAEVFSPLLPLHLDHELTSAASERLYASPRVWSLFYYEDQPYASLVPRMRERCLAQLGLRKPRECGASQPQVKFLLNRLRGLVSERDLNRVLLFWGGTSQEVNQRVWPSPSGSPISDSPS
jgi:LmbE family N-acetylglucosaminyl deacetylase